MRALGPLAALLLVLTGCGGGDSPSDEDLRIAEDFCAGAGEYLLNGMGIDKYENSEGYDRCVEDAAKVTECLDTPAAAATPWVPANCDNDGYM